MSDKKIRIENSQGSFSLSKKAQKTLTYLQGQDNAVLNEYVQAVRKIVCHFVSGDLSEPIPVTSQDFELLAHLTFELESLQDVN